jgi:drug/metabolite transporter (DMT)-like permease
MQYLVVLITSVLATLKVTFQGKLVKKEECSINDSVFYNMLIFFVASLVFCPYLFKVNSVTWLYALIYAVCNVSFQIVYALALSRGNVSLAVMFVNFGMVIPIFVSFLLFNERPSLIRIIGIVLIIISFLLTFKKGGEQKKSYLLLILLAMLFNGLGLVTQRIYARTGVQDNIFSFVSASYILSAVICAIVFLFLPKKDTEQRKLTGKTICFSAASGVALGCYLALNTYAGKFLDASFHYPAHSGCTILLSTLSGFILFKDKVSLRQIIACVVGGVAIVLMNF